ncbi:MAG: ADP-ribosylglycohydrolase family protein [Lyngbya sp.]|nr:ADP-ribosylglycohydrolase family protein [Lyngbya sp.]
MRYSLLSRFQGTLAGVSLGSQLTRSPEKFISSVASPRATHQKAQTLLNLKKHQSVRYPSDREEEGLTATDEESLVAQMTSSLIRCQGLERVDWDRSGQEWQQQNQQRKQSSTEQERDNSGRLSEKSGKRRCGLSVGEVALATLPIALYFHDQPDRLQQEVQDGIQVWQHSAPAAVGEQAILSFSHAIALALKEELDQTRLIPNLLKHLDPESDWHQQLQQVQRLAEQRVSLETAREQLLKSSNPVHRNGIGVREQVDRETTAIALAFYGFVSTPHEPAIALWRTVEIAGASPIVTALTGALSGAYNSFSSFPLSWQLQLKTTASEAQGTTEGVKFSRELLQQATELFAVWSGVYNTANPLWEKIAPTQAVAAANGMRIR